MATAEPPTTVPVSTTSMISTTKQGWKITIKNADGTSNEVILEPRALEFTMTEASPNDLEMATAEDPAKVSPPCITKIVPQYLGLTNTSQRPNSAST